MYSRISFHTSPAPSGKGLKEVPQLKDAVALALSRKIFHLHVPKSGGTALNVWLDLNVHAERARPSGFMSPQADHWFFDQEGGKQLERRPPPLKRRAQESIRRFDVMHGHVDITPWLTENAYVFTVLRDPAARSLSQFRDFRRLAAHDYTNKTDEAVAVHEACRTLPFHQIVARYGQSRFFRSTFEDGQCRILTQSSVKFPVFNSMSPEQRAAAARAAIEQRCARVGFQEHMEDLLNQIAFDFGWAPLRRLAMRNSTEESGGSESEADQAAAESLTKGDQILTAWAVGYSRQRAANDPPYGVAEFERNAVATRVRVLSPAEIGTEQVFDMNMPVIGWGFSGRDAPGTPECCSWIGPDGHAALYFPVPGPDMHVVIRLYIKGWVNENLRKTTSFLIDGNLVCPTSEERPGVREVLCFPATTRATWMKIEIRNSRTMTDTEAGRPSEDPRPKLFNLWQYSFQPL